MDIKCTFTNKSAMDGWRCAVQLFDDATTPLAARRVCHSFGEMCQRVLCMFGLTFFCDDGG